MKKLTTIFVGFFHLIIQAFTGSSQHYTATVLHAANGLPSSELLCIERDQQGYLWIGSNVGITKYDGYTFETFQYSSDNQLIGKVNTIKEDKVQRLWIGTDAGLFIRIGKSIRKYSEESESAKPINKIFEDKYSNIYLATDIGPACISKAVADTALKIDLKKFILPGWPDRNDGVPGINLISKTDDNIVYFSSNYKIYTYQNDLINEIYHYNDTHDLIVNLIPLDISRVVFNCGHSGWHKIENRNHYKLDFKKMLNAEITLPKSTQWILDYRTVFQFDPLQEIATSLIDLRQYNIYWVSDLLVDPQDIIWIATHEGLLQLQPSVFKTYDSRRFPLTEEIYSMYETSKKQFLMGGNQGKLIVLKDGESFEFSDLSPLVPLAEVKAILEDRKGRLWFGTGYQGIVLYDNNKVRHFTERDGLRDNNNTFLYETSKGRLFATGDLGLTEILVSNSNSVSFKNYRLKPRYSMHATLNASVEGPGNILWCGGLDGLYFLKDDSLHSYNFLERRISVSDIKIDKSGDLWILTEGDGIFQCSFNASHTPVLKTHYTTKNGLSSNLFMKILFDKEGNRWLTSYNGISFISKDADMIVNFNGSDIFLTPGFNSLFLYQDSKERIWAGCSKGIASFDPATITRSSYTPPAYITEVALANSGQDVLAYDVNSGDGVSKRLSLSYDKNYLRFQYVAIDHSNQQNLQYHYQLAGLDTAWINAGNQRSVIYQHLAPGDYSFKVKALNNKGTWSHTATCIFIINKPFWATWWFVVSIILASVVVLFAIIRSRDKSIRKKAEMEALVEKQISDLKIKALRSKMNPHFIFNCLNSIDNLIQTDEKDKATVYLSKFAKLIRAILENSKYNEVSCWKDLESLKLYLELEEFRYDNIFSCEIKIADEILQGDYKVPPLIIQPFVENAIHHGLLNKQFGSRNLKIDVMVNDNIIKYTITDNGVGRAQANAYKQINGDTHFSMGMEVTIDRINLFNNAEHEGVKITDLKDENDRPAGTQIEVWLLN